MHQQAAQGVLIALICLTGCGGTQLQLTEAGARVKLMKADPPPDCTDVGSVSGFAIGPDFQEAIKTKIRNAAAEKGGNYVRLESVDSHGNNLSGTAFRCPGIAPAPAPSQPTQ